MAERDWQLRAACREADLELFYSGIDHDIQIALSFCDVCDVRETCRDEAFARREHFGVWGGTTERERRRMFRAERRRRRQERRDSDAA